MTGMNCVNLMDSHGFLSRGYKNMVIFQTFGGIGVFWFKKNCIVLDVNIENYYMMEY